MNKKLYTACGAAAIALVACSDDNGRLVGTSVEPNTIGELSSSSVDTPSSSSFDAREGDLWNPSAGGFSLNVARYAAKLPANAKADGHWTLESDAEKGGTSSVVWPTDLVGVQDERTVVESCDGICGTVSLAKYSLTYNPFAGVGFTLAKDDNGKPVPVDVTDWEGVCMTYESEAAPALELDLGDSVNALLGEALPAVALPKTVTTGPVTKCFKWSDFKYPAWIAAVAGVPEYWLENSGEKAAKQLVAFRFVISASPGEYKFNIKSLGTLADFQAKQGESSSSAEPAVVNPADLWDGAAGDKTVKTGLYADDSWKSLAKGKWYDYTDQNSSFGWWKYKAYDDHNGFYFEQVIDECGGLCSSVKLVGTAEVDPVALFGFQLANNESGVVKAVDITNWNGVCVTYKTDIPIVLDLDPVSLEVDFDTASAGFVVEEDDYEIYKWPSVTLPVTSGESTMCYAWDDFKQAYLDKVPNGEKYKTTVENVLKRVVTIRFIITGKAGDKGNFFLKALGTNRK
jgi:hypothetical protein